VINRINTNMHSSILRRIWFNFMANYMGFFRLLYSFQIFFPHFQRFVGRSTIEQTYIVKIRIWCIKIGIVLVLHFSPRVEASTGRLQVPDGLYSPVTKCFSTCLKMRNWIKLSRRKANFINSSRNEGIYP
jgi:hypothetical protein